MLLGAEHFFTFVKINRAIDEPENPRLIQSVFGWIVTGRNKPNACHNVCNIVICKPLPDARKQSGTIKQVEYRRPHSLEEQLSESKNATRNHDKKTSTTHSPNGVPEVQSVVRNNCRTHISRYRKYPIVLVSAIKSMHDQAMVNHRKRVLQRFEQSEPMQTPQPARVEGDTHLWPNSTLSNNLAVHYSTGKTMQKEAAKGRL